MYRRRERRGECMTEKTAYERLIERLEDPAGVPAVDLDEMYDQAIGELEDLFYPPDGDGDLDVL